MNQTFFKIGNLAQRAGLTVRALHHYDAIGLLSPSVRTASGARRYGPQDLIRLHRIQAMKQLGYALQAIQATLDDADVDPLGTMQRHVHALETRARQARKLSQGLRALMDQLSDGRTPLPVDWLDSLEMMAIYQNHLVEEEVQTLYTPNTAPRPASAKQVERLWATLVFEVNQAINGNLSADSPQAHALAWRWVRLVIEKTNNNPALAIKLRALQTQEARAQAITGITPATMDWVGQAIAFARTALFAKYLTPEQTLALKARQLRTMADLDRWPRLMVKVQEHLEAGTPVKDVAVQALAHDWQRLFRECYCGEDAEMEVGIRTAFAKEPNLMLGVGVSESLMAYMREAMEYMMHRHLRR